MVLFRFTVFFFFPASALGLLQLWRGGPLRRLWDVGQWPRRGLQVGRPGQRAGRQAAALLAAAAQGGGKGLHVLDDGCQGPLLHILGAGDAEAAAKVLQERRPGRGGGTGGIDSTGASGSTEGIHSRLPALATSHLQALQTL